MRGVQVIDGRRPSELAQIPVRFARQSQRGTSTDGCGACLAVNGDLTIPVNENVDAKDKYRMQIFCGGTVFLFVWDSGLTWLCADTFDLDCGGETPVTLYFSMVVSGTGVGQVDVYAKDVGGGIYAHWESETKWQPCIYVVTELVEFNEDCPCAPWKPESCLVPVHEP